MAYSDFTLWDLESKFGITNAVVPLFDAVPPIEPDAFLLKTIERGQTLSLRNEKIKSEAVVFPVLLDVIKRNEDFFTLFSGETLPARREAGLTGECDFIITKNTHSLNPNLPVFSVVEAKRDNFDLGIPQCAAQMLGARLLNQDFAHPVEIMHGCVTTAEQWRFLRLEGNRLLVDKTTYTLRELPTILGIFQRILDHYREFLSAQGYQAEEPIGTYDGYWPWATPPVPASSPVFE